MAQAVLWVEGLPRAASDAAKVFYEAWLPLARAALSPPRDGEGDRPRESGDGGGESQQARHPMANPLRHAACSGAPPPRAGEDLAIVFPSAPYDHRGWRLSAVQDLAREAAPGRVNGVVGDDRDAIAATVDWLASSPGVTGQLLAVDGNSGESG